MVMMIDGDDDKNIYIGNGDDCDDSEDEEEWGRGGGGETMLIQILITMITFTILLISSEIKQRSGQDCRTRTGQKILVRIYITE